MVFSIANALLWRSLQVPAPQEIRFLQVSVGSITGPLPYGDRPLLDPLRPLFQGISIAAADAADTELNGQITRISGEMVSANYLQVMGVSPLVGGFGDPSSNRSTPPVIVSFGLWQRYFKSGGKALGQIVHLGRSRAAGQYETGQAYVLTGVMPENFIGTKDRWQASDYWVLLDDRIADYTVDLVAGDRLNREKWFPTVGIARLAEGVDDERLDAQLNSIRPTLAPEYPSGTRIQLVATKDLQGRLPFGPKGRVAPARLAAALISLTIVLLAIVVSNVVGILLARGVARRRVTFVQIALGATRVDLVAESVGANLFLTGCAVALGIICSRISVRAFLASVPAEMGWRLMSQPSLSAPFDGRVGVFAIVTTIVTAGLLSLAPLLQIRRIDRTGGRTEGFEAITGRRRLLLLVPQACLSFALLVCSIHWIRQDVVVDRWGFGPERVLTADFAVAVSERPLDRADLAAQFERRRRICDRIMQSSNALGSVSSAALSSGLPTHSAEAVVVSQEDGLTGLHRRVAQWFVSEGFFATLSVPMLSGRDFGPGDRVGSQPVAIVSRSLADAMWPGQSPIGQHLGFHTSGSPSLPAWLEVIGVAAGVADQASDRFSGFAVYVSLFQQRNPPATTILLKTRDGQPNVEGELRRVIAGAGDGTAAIQVVWLKDVVESLTYRQALSRRLLAFAGVFAVLLNGLGLYGVVSYWTALRTREMAIRQAIGATPLELLRMIIVEGLRVAFAGAVLGAALALTLTGLIRRYVVDVSAIDPGSFAVAVLVVSLATCLACFAPARRASKSDPLSVLRD